MKKGKSGKYKNFIATLKIFSFFFGGCFLIGMFHAVQDNVKGHSDAEIFEYITSEFHFKMNTADSDTAAWIENTCKGNPSFSIDFNYLDMSTNPGMIFKAPSYDLAFLSFERCATIVGATAFSVYTAKDFVSEYRGLAKKQKGKILAAVLGVLSGYSLGYYVFRDNVACDSKELEVFLNKWENRRNIKKYAIAQLFNSDIFSAEKGDSLDVYDFYTCEYGTLLKYTNHKGILPPGEVDAVALKELEVNFVNSYNKTWKSVDSVRTRDIMNIRKRAAYWKEIYSNKNNLDPAWKIEFTNLKKNDEIS